MEIFISHSSKDSDLALALIELLRGALNIPQDQIRCTSVDGYRLPAGARTEDQLRTEVRSATVFIGLITPASIQSAYVLFELGARWGADLHLVPLLAAGIQPNTLRGPLSNLNALSCDDVSQVHQLVYDVAMVLGRSSNSPASFLRYINSLVSLSKQHVTSLAKPSVINPVTDEGLLTQEGTETIADFDEHEIYYGIHFVYPPSLSLEYEQPSGTKVKILEQRTDGFRYRVNGRSFVAGERFTWKAKGIRKQTGT